MAQHRETFALAKRTQLPALAVLRHQDSADFVRELKPFGDGSKKGGMITFSVSWLEGELDSLTA